MIKVHILAYPLSQGNTYHVLVYQASRYLNLGKSIL